MSNEGKYAFGAEAAHPILSAITFADVSSHENFSLAVQRDQTGFKRAYARLGLHEIDGTGGALDRALEGLLLSDVLREDRYIGKKIKIFPRGLVLGILSRNHSNTSLSLLGFFTQDHVGRPKATCFGMDLNDEVAAKDLISEFGRKKMNFFVPFSRECFSVQTTKGKTCLFDEVGQGLESLRKFPASNFHISRFVAGELEGSVYDRVPLKLHKIIMDITS